MRKSQPVANEEDKILSKNLGTTVPLSVFAVMEEIHRATGMKPIEQSRQLVYAACAYFKKTGKFDPKIFLTRDILEELLPQHAVGEAPAPYGDAATARAREEALAEQLSRAVDELRTLIETQQKHSPGKSRRAASSSSGKAG